MTAQTTAQQNPPVCQHPAGFQQDPDPQRADQEGVEARKSLYPSIEVQDPADLRQVIQKENFQTISTWRTWRQKS